MKSPACEVSFHLAFGVALCTWAWDVMLFCFSSSKLQGGGAKIDNDEVLLHWHSTSQVVVGGGRSLSLHILYCVGFAHNPA